MRPIARAQNSASDYVAHLRFSHGRGALCWTTDGHEYIDLICGQGPIILGHANPAVVDAVARELQNGSLLPSPGPAFYRLEERLLELYPHHEEMLAFKSGSEAVAAAIRLARAHTERSLVLRVGFHGWHDQVISPYVRCHSYDAEYFEQSWPSGVPHSIYAPVMRTWHGNNAHELVNCIRDISGDLAAVIIDPVQISPDDAVVILPKISQILHRSGALLILDESKTGFRVHMGGVQALYNVTGDLTILSKAIANGLPLAVVLARKDIIKLAQDVRIKGTFGPETASIAAALVTIRILEEEDGPSVLCERGTLLIRRLNDVIQTTGFSPSIVAVPYQWACMPYIHFRGAAADLQTPFHSSMVAKGVLMLRDHMSYISLGLTEGHVECVASAAFETLCKLSKKSS